MHERIISDRERINEVTKQVVKFAGRVSPCAVRVCVYLRTVFENIIFHEYAQSTLYNACVPALPATRILVHTGTIIT